MYMMFFFISFNYTILRDTKDTLVLDGGPEVIPFLKLWGVVPAAVLFMIIYAKLSNILSKERLFYVTIVPFLVFFALFAWVFYPLRDFLHPNASADYLQSIVPQGLSGLVACYRNWTYSLFYILAELWGSAVLSLLFWGFANDIMKVSEAKRCYTLLGIGANVALLCSGPVIMYFSSTRKGLAPGVDSWQISLNYLMSAVVLAGLAVIGIYWWMQRNVLTDPRFYDPSQLAKVKKEKPKMSLKDSFSFLISSPYILLIAAVVVCYGITINLVEVTWKGQLKLQYPDKNDYSAFMGQFSTYTGAMTVTMMLIGGYILRTQGWRFAAMITPIMLCVTGALFYSFIIFRESDMLKGFVLYFGSTPLMMAVILGMMQNIATKSTKYSLFDPTKEMTYIPLDQESKVKGKAAIDVVGARLGKSGGSAIQIFLIIIFGSVAQITPYIAVMFLGIVVLWMFAVNGLSKRFVALTQDKSIPKEKDTVKLSGKTAAETA